MSIAEKRIHDAALRLFAERGATQVTVSELAEAAGVARGTIYNRLGDVGALFEQVAARLTHEMTQRIDATLEGISDPAQRVSLGMRLFVRRAHEEPIWGRFVLRFASSAPNMRTILTGGPAKDLQRGIRSRRFELRKDQLVPALAMMSSGALSGIALVVEGQQTWREAGSSTAELFLRALGIPPDEARALAAVELPSLEHASS